MNSTKATVKTLIKLLTTIISGLIFWLTRLLNWISSDRTQMRIFDIIRRIDVARTSGLISSTIKKFLHWTLGRRGLRANRPAMTASLLVTLIIIYQLTGGYDLADLKDAGELVVVSRESDTTWYQDSNGEAGPEYEYMASLAEYLEVDLRFDIRRNDQAVIDAIRENEGHLAAAGFTRDPWLEEKELGFSPPYHRVDQQVVCRRNRGRLPKNIQELTDSELVVIENSSEEAHLLELQNSVAGLTWESVDETTVDDLLEQVWRKEIKCTVANSHVIKIKRRLYPELQVGFTLRQDLALTWTLSPEWTFLSDTIQDWLETIEKDGSLLILRDRHYSEDEFDYVDMRSFIRRIESRLPRLVPIIKEAAEKYDIPWTLLAAQAYQESHWNRRAKSPTGVRGVMMLTLVTAREVGVESRLDARQSIMGGAMYMKKLESRVPDSVTESNRWWYALAAYNVGMGHVHDARKLTEELNLDPDSWLDLKGVLPLLSKKKYYKDLKHGFARGAEPVTYVRRIRQYENILRAQLVRKQGIHAG